MKIDCGPGGKHELLMGCLVTLPLPAAWCAASIYHNGISIWLTWLGIAIGLSFLMWLAFKSFDFFHNLSKNYDIPKSIRVLANIITILHIPVALALFISIGFCICGMISGGSDPNYVIW
jgi:hypothetical protein